MPPSRRRRRVFVRSPISDRNYHSAQLSRIVKMEGRRSQRFVRYFNHNNMQQELPEREADGVLGPSIARGPGSRNLNRRGGGRGRSRGSRRHGRGRRSRNRQLASRQRQPSPVALGFRGRGGVGVEDQSNQRQDFVSQLEFRRSPQPEYRSSPEPARPSPQRELNHSDDDDVIYIGESMQSNSVSPRQRQRQQQQQQQEAQQLDDSDVVMIEHIQANRPMVQPEGNPNFNNLADIASEQLQQLVACESGPHHNLRRSPARAAGLRSADKKGRSRPTRKSPRTRKTGINSTTADNEANDDESVVIIGDAHAPPPPIVREPRLVIVDGSNVAMSHGRELVKGTNKSAQFSSIGIQICVDKVHSMGNPVMVFLPQHRLKGTTRDVGILKKLEKEGILKVTPSRVVGEARICPYDDRFMLEVAHERGGIIVTQDNFRDLYAEKREWRSTIANQVLPYMWIDRTDIKFPGDPLGEGGPTLQDFLLH